MNDVFRSIVRLIGRLGAQQGNCKGGDEDKSNADEYSDLETVWLLHDNLLKHNIIPVRNER